ncbi:MAG TPA: aldehyde dehydrogenase family protein, partial [Solirubrobacteraceae bacterium]|nr:aldehyde dehydrogenase family protein [Solirubrobacteraceae bacterium]
MTTLEIKNPATAQTIAETPAAGPGEVDAAVRKAREAFASWGTTTPAARASAL